MGKRILNDTLELITEFKKDFIENDYSIKDLCIKHSCSPAVIQRFLKKHNIKKMYKYTPSAEDVVFIIQELEKGSTYKSIADTLQVPAYLISSYVKRNINRSKKWSNELEDTSWIEEQNPLFWYVLGLLASDGHLGKFNEICFFQKDGRFIKHLQKWIHHNGVLYGKSCYTIHINNALLHAKLEKLGFSSNKRYSIPFIEAPNESLQWLFIRGLFDGDGSLYFNYTSGRFEGINWQITSGSKNMTEGICKFLAKQNIKYYTDKCISIADNPYYHIGVRAIESIKQIFSLLYKDNIEYKLPIKYGKFLKILKVIEINKQVDDIVEAAMKIVD